MASDHDNWINGVTDMFGQAGDDFATSPAPPDNYECPCGCGMNKDTPREVYEAEHMSLAKKLFGKEDHELSDEEYQEYMQHIKEREEGLS